MFTKYDLERLPNWRGIDGIKFHFNGAYSDSYLIYRKYVFTAEDIESALWEDFLTQTNHKDSESGNPQVENEFTEWLKNDKATEYLEDCIDFGCCLGKCRLSA